MLKVLLVEDEDLIRKGLRFKVDWTAIECTVIGEAVNGRDALEIIKEKQPDIVITDIEMQEMNGLELLKCSMEEYGYDAIIISGYDKFAYAQQALRLGAGEYLLKPIDIEELKASIKKIAIKREQAESMHISYKDIDMPVPDQSMISNKYAKIMLQYIKEHYAEHISLMDLSQSLDISCTHLNSKFKLETGYTFHDFLNYYRINRAIELQKTRKYKMYEIAEMVGFADYKYFNKVYKHYVGCSPNQFIEQV